MNALEDTPSEVSWASRADFWLEESEPKTIRRRREREKHPLILTGHGLSLRVDKGCLLVRDGNTHYPADRREWRFFKGALDIPPAFIILDGSGEITLDAMDWLATQDVPLIRLRWDGEFSSIVTSSGQAASSELVRWQVDTRDDPAARVDFALKLIQKKASNTAATMESHVPRSNIWDSAMYGIQRRIALLEDIQPKSVIDVLGFEGGIAADYFRAWSAIRLKWKATKRYPIPKEWQQYTSRSAVRERQHKNNRATHPVNAMLNYAYAVITARTQVQLIADGYDPRIGILHDNKRRRGTYPAFALDHIEPIRPVVDRAILELIDTKTFTGADFSVQDDGVCRLNPEFARRVAQLSLKSFDIEVPGQILVTGVVGHAK